MPDRNTWLKPCLRGPKSSAGKAVGRESLSSTPFDEKSWRRKKTMSRLAASRYRRALMQAFSRFFESWANTNVSLPEEGVKVFALLMDW